MPHRSRARLQTVLATLSAAAAIVLWARLVPAAAQSGGLPIETYRVVRAYPHDSSAFTQGLEVVDGFFYEGTGLNGRSSIRKVRIETGEVVQSKPLEKEHFGEGITLVGDTLYQLTWQSGLAFLYDRTSFRRLRSVKYTGEGWGLTHDAKELIMSDGTDALRFLDPATFRELRRIHVSAVGQPLKNLNELEYVQGEVLANVWMTDYIARIDPATGRVRAYIDMRGLLTMPGISPDAVLNGIAYDAAKDRLFVTGKLWPRVFEVQIARKAIG